MSKELFMAAHEQLIEEYLMLIRLPPIDARSGIMKKTKIVSPAVRMQALALFTMANQNYLRGAAYIASLSELLGFDDDWAGLFGDAVLDDRPDFDAVFKNEGFKIQSKSKIPKRKK